jgi:uncharacterized delta-60 repeat protein
VVSNASGLPRFTVVSTQREGGDVRPVIVRSRGEDTPKAKFTFRPPIPSVVNDISGRGRALSLASGSLSGVYDRSELFKAISKVIVARGPTVGAAPNPTFALAASSASVNEGSSTNFVLTTSNVASGSQVAYTLSGVSAADVQGGSLTGTATIGADGRATITVGLLADNLTEGTETLSVAVGGATASTSVSDTSLAPPVSVQWTKLLGTAGHDAANALTTGLDGSIYVGGWTGGNLDGQTNSGQTDAFLTKYNLDGSKAWTKLLGSSRLDRADALTTGLDGSIYVSGLTDGNLDGQTNNSAAYDAFLTKFNPDGSKAWTKLLGTAGQDWATALTTGLDGSIYVSGVTSENMDGQANTGRHDAFLTKYDPDGSKAWTKLLGSTSDDVANALTTGLDGSIYVGGWTGGNLDGQTNNGQMDAFLTKYNPDGNKVWTKLLGSTSDVIAQALTTGLDGSIYVSGPTASDLDGQTFSGNRDAFLTKYNPDGSKVWTKLLGAADFDMAYALTTGLDGSIYVSGQTAGNLDGQTNSGNSDAFLTKYNPDGSKFWTKLLGTTGSDQANALTTGLDGSIYVSGQTAGNLDGQTQSGQGDAFLTKFER